MGGRTRDVELIRDSDRLKAQRYQLEIGDTMCFGANETLAHEMDA